MNNFYDAASYEQHARVTKLCAFEVLAKNYEVIEGINPPAKVFDAGCGPGTIAKLMANSFYNIVEIFAMDISTDMISVAMSVNKDPRIGYHVGDTCDVTSWPIELQQLSGKIDLATSFASLHWSKDPLLALRNIYEVLKPGGFLIGWADALPNAEPRVTILEQHLKTSAKWLKFFKVMISAI